MCSNSYFAVLYNSLEIKYAFSIKRHTCMQTNKQQYSRCHKNINLLIYSANCSSSLSEFFVVFYSSSYDISPVFSFINFLQPEVIIFCSVWMCHFPKWNYTPWKYLERVVKIRGRNRSPRQVVFIDFAIS